jgi:anti-sigma factor RsiW
MNIFPHHIPYGQLADYVDGDLPLVKRVDLETHLATCSRCSEELTHLEHLIRLMRTDTAEDAPSSVINRAVDLFRFRKVTNSTTDLRRRIQAVLQFNSVGSAPAFGVRSGQPGAHQLLFSAAEYRIDLRIEPSGQAWVVSGQVLGGSTANGIAVLKGPVDINQASINELNEFILQPVQAGSYKLLLNLGNFDVEMTEISIGL